MPTALSDVASDFSRVAHLLREASYEIRCRCFSSYPLFVRCTEVPKLGVCLIAAGEKDAEAHYHASSLEELNKVGFIEDTEVFSQRYKDPDQYCCLLLIEPEEIQFVYLPYPKMTSSALAAALVLRAFFARTYLLVCNGSL